MGEVVLKGRGDILFSEDVMFPYYEYPFCLLYSFLQNIFVIKSMTVFFDVWHLLSLASPSPPSHMWAS